MKTLFIIIFFITCFSANCKVDTLSLTRENVELVIREMGLHHEDIVMRQAILETGNFKSHLAKENTFAGFLLSSRVKTIGRASQDNRSQKPRQPIV